MYWSRLKKYPTTRTGVGGSSDSPVGSPVGGVVSRIRYGVVPLSDVKTSASYNSLIPSSFSRTGKVVSLRRSPEIVTNWPRKCSGCFCSTEKATSRATASRSACGRSLARARIPVIRTAFLATQSDRIVGDPGKILLGHRPPRRGGRV
ncbi:MAG: hypothetical protein CM1200mP2_44980 [Planctomycetaceae bacterium]|nr:MAG: hypothetical protein CM1200mP2_44980 [Planctomycetaceae bacterium]